MDNSNSKNNKKRLFNDMLSNIIDLAGRNGNVLKQEDIFDAFEGIIDDDSMYGHVFKYLADNKIRIEGIETKEHTDSSKETELEKTFVEMYKNDLKGIDIPSDAEMLLILKEHLAGNDCLQKLTEAHLHMVIDIIGNYGNMGVTAGDLIQEGNLGLMEGIQSYKGAENLEDFREYIEYCIHNAIKDAIDEQNGSERVGKHIADRANALDHAASELAKDLEREPTLSELAEFLALSEDEVEKIMKISLDALTIDAEGAIAEENK